MKKILICLVCIISVVCSFVFGFYYCREEVIRGTDSLMQKQIDRIAIVNLDEGIEIDNNRILYSSQLLKSVADYVYVGLNEARAGLETDMYAAYIIIPADFSECIESINDVPRQAEVKYMVNTGLTDRNRLEVEENLSIFKEVLNTNTAYVYLSSVLSELHSAQDSASVILEHDKEDLKNIKNINPEDIFNMIEFSDLNEVDNQIENVDLSPYIKKNSTEVENIAAEINKGIREGQQKYQSVTKEYSTVSTNISAVQEMLSDYNPLMDVEGNEVYRSGLDQLDIAIDNYNENLDIEGIEGFSEINQLIADVSNEYLDMELGKAQKTTDNKLEEIQKQSQELIDKKVAEWSEEQMSYYRGLSEYVNDNLNKYAINTKLEMDNVLKAVMEERANVTTDVNQIMGNSGKKEEVISSIEQYSNRIIACMNNLLSNCKIRDIDFNSYSEKTPPNYKENGIILPQVEKLYEEEKEEDKTEEEEKDSETEKVSIDIDEDLEPEKNLPQFIQKKDEDINGMIDSVKSNFLLSKSDISDIIDEQIIDSIETENKKEIDNYKEVTAGLLSSMQDYDGKVTAFNPYDYIKQTEIAKHQTALTKNILALGTAMNKKNEEYLEFINKVYQTADENVNILQKDLQKANDFSKKELNAVITKLKADKDRISQEDNDILEDFSKRLEYSRLGSLQYTDMYRFMVQPVGVSDQSDADEVQDTDSVEKLELNYKWIALIVFLVLLLFAATSLMIKIIRDRKELRAFEKERYEQY